MVYLRFFLPSILSFDYLSVGKVNQPTLRSALLKNAQGSGEKEIEKNLPRPRENEIRHPSPGSTNHPSTVTRPGLMPRTRLLSGVDRPP